jgi:hypothetical protein
MTTSGDNEGPGSRLVLLDGGRMAWSWMKIGLADRGQIGPGGWRVGEVDEGRVRWIEGGYGGL